MMFSNPEKILVCEVYNGEVINGPAAMEYPFQGYLLPARVIYDWAEPLEQYLHEPTYTITDTEVIVHYEPKPLPEGSGLTVYKTFAKNKIKEKRREKEEGGVLFNGYTIDTSRTQQTELTEKLKIGLQNPTGMFPVLTTAGYISVDFPTLRSIGELITNHVQACFTSQKNAEDAIDAATTVEEVKGIIDGFN